MCDVCDVNLLYAVAASGQFESTVIGTVAAVLFVIIILVAIAVVVIIFVLTKRSHRKKECKIIHSRMFDRR